jgi:hypothetical protein
MAANYQIVLVLLLRVLPIPVLGGLPHVQLHRSARRVADDGGHDHRVQVRGFCVHSVRVNAECIVVKRFRYFIQIYSI